jgi:hypothetical protein
MGIKEKLETAGSIYAANANPTAPTNGENITPNPLSTNQSKMHATPEGTAGYSLNGANQSLVASQYTSYNDGSANTLPNPSELDLNGTVPSPYTNPETGVTYIQ